jgi:hypothetical protein
MGFLYLTGFGGDFFAWFSLGLVIKSMRAFGGGTIHRFSNRHFFAFFCLLIGKILVLYSTGLDFYPPHEKYFLFYF